MNGEQLEINLIDTVILVQTLDNKDISSYRHIEAPKWDRNGDSGTTGELTPSQVKIQGPSFDVISWIDIDGFFGTFYKKQFFNEIWNVQLRKFLESVRDGQRLEDIELEFVIKALYEDYITELIESRNCGELLTPEQNVYSYLISDILPCRDQILHSEVLRLMGLNILNSKTSDGNQTVLEILKRAIENTDFWKSLPKITYEAEAKPPRSLKESIMSAWDIVTLFHEVGRLETSYQKIFEYVEEYVLYGDADIPSSLREEFYRLHSKQMEPGFPDHGVKNKELFEILIRTVSVANKEKVSDAKICIAPYFLAKDSLAAETQYLRGIIEDHNAGMKALELWENDPLGCLFVTVLLLAGLPVRICWNSKSGRAIENGAEFTPDDIGIYMPVKGLQLCQYPSQKPRLIYKVVEEYAPVARKELEKFPPLDEPRINFLRVALGPQCLQLLSEEELEAEWDWVEFANSNEEGEVTSVKKKYSVAFSFPGEYRETVENVANELKKLLPGEQIFYDKWYESKLAQPNLDTELEKIYNEEVVELIVVFLCKEYNEKEWCGTEGRLIRELIKHKKDKMIMFLRFDDAKVNGILSIDGYIDINNMEAPIVAKKIFQRLHSNRTSS